MLKTRKWIEEVLKLAERFALKPYIFTFNVNNNFWKWHFVNYILKQCEPRRLLVTVDLDSNLENESDNLSLTQYANRADKVAVE
jgi:hypothetical protein